MHDTMNDDLRAAVEQLLRFELAPAYNLDGSQIEVLDVTDGVARVRLGSACASCPATLMTLVAQLESELRDRLPAVEFLEAIA